MTAWKKKEEDPLAPLRRTARWKNLALAIRARYPLCRMCNKVGVGEVHHIEDGPEKFFDPSNLIGLCIPCHEKVSGAYKRGGFAKAEVQRVLRERLKMKHAEAMKIAQRRMAELAPHCDRIAIAGSLRREKGEVGDIEIVAIPKPYDVGLFASGIATVVNAWEKVRGELPCKYTQRMLPEGIALDLFFATEENWGLIFAIRTGSADYSHRVLAEGWVRHGYHSENGMLCKNGFPVPVREEADLFGICGLSWVDPRLRELMPNQFGK